MKMFAFGLIGAGLATWLLRAELGLNLSAFTGWILGWLIALAIDLRGIHRPDAVRLAARMILLSMASASLLLASLGVARIATLGGLRPPLAFAVLFFAGMSLVTLWGACRVMPAGRR